jgi:outer membrane protein assembly factor BamA
MLCITLFWSSCATNLYLEKGQWLLKGEPTFSKADVILPDSASNDSIFTLKERIENLKEIGLSTVDPDLLYNSVKTHPNRRMLIPKTYLHIFNLGRTLQRYEYPPERWLRFFRPNNHIVDSLASFLVNTAGEPPVIIDSMQLLNDVENLKTVYFSQGFFHARVDTRVDTCTSGLNRGKANVTFLITEGKAAIIDKIRTPSIVDEEMRKVLLRNMDDSYLHTGDCYIEDNFSAERSRIATLLRNNGYYTFSPKMVSFDIDTLPPDTMGTLPNNEAIKEYQPVWVQVKIADTIPPYKIGNISMIIEPAKVDPSVDQMMQVVMPGFITDSLRQAWHLTRHQYGDSALVTFITYERVLERLNLSFLEKLITLSKGDVYTLANERKTQMRLQNLGIFKYVLIKPTVNPEDTTVDFSIQTVLMQRFQAKAGFEAFFQTDPILKANLPGIGAEVGFRDKLVFKGAEKLDLSMKGDVRFYRSEVSDTVNDIISTKDTLVTFLQGSLSASLQFPRILAPGLARKNLQGFEPSTSFIVTGSRQQSIDYARNALSLDWNYRWYHSSVNKKAQSSFSPYVITFIQSHLEPRIIDEIRKIENNQLRSIIIQDFQPRFSSWGNYRFTYNNGIVNKNTHSLSFVGNFQVGGNTPFLLDRITNIDDSWKDHRLSYIFYGQYLKLSAEVKNHWPIQRHFSFVMRNYMGIADPWNYTRFVPFESRFFSGGTNSMRGWQSNTLGPGVFSDSTNGEGRSGQGFLLSPGGEFVFETNLEFRADVYKWIKLAIFSDIGNVWFLPGSAVDFEGGQLSKETVLQLGIDAGIGIRLDFDFFLFRIDFAKQVYAPDVQRFVIKSLKDNLGGNRFQLNFGIGYPF